MTKTANQPTCIQIGLWDSAEYIYLTDPNWTERMQHVAPIYRLPHEVCYKIDAGPWLFYGVDESPSSVINLAKKHNDLDDNVAKWLVAHISNNSSGYQIITDWEKYSDELFFVYVPKITLAGLFNGFGLDDVTLLAMDIEGSEWGILATHDWKVCPQIIAVEIHSYYYFNDDTIDTPPYNQSGADALDMLEKNCVKMENLLRQHGYNLAFKGSTNQFGPQLTMELKFVRAASIG